MVYHYYDENFPVKNLDRSPLKIRFTNFQKVVKKFLPYSDETIHQACHAVDGKLLYT